MEFDDMKKIWDEQSQQSMYAIDEEALSKKVIKKRHKASFIANRTEILMIGALLIASAMVWAATIYTGELQLLPLGLSGFMVIMAILLYRKRVKRLSWQNTFDQTILGDLDEAIANAQYQLNVSKWSRNLFFVVAGLTVVDVFSVESWWKAVVVSGFFVIVYFLAKWEYRTFYLSQKNELKSMKDKLISLEND